MIYEYNYIIFIFYFLKNFYICFEMMRVLLLIGLCDFFVIKYYFD